MRRLVVILLAMTAMLSGCAGTSPRLSAVPEELFADAAFAAPSTPVGSAGLFTLTQEMRDYLHSARFQSLLRSRGTERGLVTALYSKTDLQLEYESAYTRTAAETFRDRSGNCLSLVIMTAAFAKELGMSVSYRNVDMESWSRSGDVYMLSGHVNILLGTRSPSLLSETRVGDSLLVDFLPSPQNDPNRTHPLEEEDIVAMFMNNRAAETLVEGRLSDAYWWARAAVAGTPHNAMALNTLGVIYQRHGDPLMAERVYRAALAREPENVNTLRNLEPLLAALGKTAEAQAIAQQLARLEPAPPFLYFNQGVAAYRKGEYDKARELFRREVRRDPYNDEFHFWLGVVNFELGDLGTAEKQLALARDTSVRGEADARYSAKLAHLRSMAGGPGRN